MQSGRILVLLAVAIALFAVLQIAESKTISEEAKAIEKHVDEEFKKLSKRATDEEDDGAAKHKKGKKRKASSTAAPGDAKSVTATPTPASDAKGTTKAPAGTTGAPSSTGAPTTGHPDEPKGGSTTAAPKSGSTTAAAKSGGSSTGKPKDMIEKDADAVKKAREKQSQERDVIRRIFNETSNWKKWLEENNHKTLNPKAAGATWILTDTVRKMVYAKTPKPYPHRSLDW